MALIPERNLIKKAMESDPVLQEPRTYIGMSSLNSACARRTWYDFHWSYDRYITKRTARIFERGDLEEPRVVADLLEAGMIVSNVLEAQTELVDDTGHIKGHPDGSVLKVPGAEKTEHALEIKTMNNTRFKTYLKQGLKTSDPSYWGQVHTYMGEQGLTRCLFIVTNKDNEERNYERIKYEPEVHKECMRIGFDILTSEQPPKKIGEKTWFECKFCDAREICHKGAPISRNCRTCKFFNIEMKGEFACGNPICNEAGITVLPTATQRTGCKFYEISEVF